MGLAPKFDKSTLHRPSDKFCGDGLKPNSEENLGVARSKTQSVIGGVFYIDREKRQNVEDESH